MPARADLDVEALAEELFCAFETGQAVLPLSERGPGLEVDDAYRVQRLLQARHETAGRKVVGRKVGLTSLAMQRQLGVHEPDFGVVLDSHRWGSGARLDVAALRMIAPRLEAELGFILDRPLAGEAVTAADVLSATRAVVPLFEVIDSRIVDWRITLPDTIADNASCFGVVVGEPVAWRGADMGAIGLVFEHDGEVVVTAAGAAVLGDPARAVAWLASRLTALGEVLPAGELVLAGSFTAALPAAPGHYRARFGDGVGSVEVTIDG